jgi:hypothetical protein
MFQKENTWLRSADYSISDFDFNKEMADVLFNVSLNEVNKDETLYVIVKEEENEEEEKFKMEKQEGLNYTVNKELSSSKNYNVQLLSEGESSFRSAQLFNIYLKDYIIDLYDVNIRPLELSRRKSKSFYEFSLFVQVIPPKKYNFDLDKDELLIKDLYVQAYNGDTLLETYYVIKDSIKNEEIFNNKSSQKNIPERAVRELKTESYENYEVFINGESNEEIDFENLMIKAYLTNNTGYTYEYIFSIRDHEVSKKIVGKE